MDFPTATWGRVVKPPSDEPDLLAVRIESDKGGSFLILTREPEGEFDTWVKGRRDVVDYLATLVVDWDGSAR